MAEAATAAAPQAAKSTKPQVELSTAQKAAAVIIALGAEKASRVYKYMEDEEVKIVRTKKFDIKPMYPEDACLEMELLGHNFYMFLNAETDQISVVYKRKANSYGLIEPEA